jgi:alcohol dehydrogenase (cytochrome c)
MRRLLPLLCLLVSLAFAQQPASTAVAPAATQTKPADVKVYPSLCGKCHGADMKGGTGPSILQYIRYHTDIEVTEVLRDSPAHKGLRIPDDQLRRLLADVRVLAGTNPNMATAGFTGKGFTYGRGGREIAESEANRPSVSAKIPDFEPRQETLMLNDGHKLSGTLMAQTVSDAQLLAADGKFHLLTRVGETYLDKPIEPRSDWLTYHGSDSGNRYSTLDQINSSNVQKIAVAWKFPIPSSPRLQGTPIVVDGIMYMTGWNELYAIDATTGSPIWSYHEPHTAGILGEAGRGSNRGVAISGDRVFLLTDRAHMLAFNRKTGAKLWNVELGSVKDSVMASTAPLIVGDLIMVGVGGGEEGIRGFIDAYKINNGEHAWRFYTIPKRGDKIADTWVGNALEHGCGATWMTGSYDPKLGLVYWGTGNPCPDSNGAERVGSNLYTDSVVALSPKTGELKWYFQFTPHDTHDWDSTQSMILVDRKWEGKERKLLLHGDRNGYFYVLDRTNGKLLLAQPLSSKVTWTSGYTKDGHPILTPASESTPGGTAVCPAGSGGANWPDPSFDPQTNLFLARVADSCGIFTASVDPLSKVNRWTGGGMPDEKARQEMKDIMAGYAAGDYIRAVDIFTGKKVWDYRFSERSGVLSTAGGLVFIGGPGGLTILDAKTGKELGNVDADAPPVLPPVLAASPMTYMVGGKQYVVLSATGIVVAYALRN